MPAAELSIHAQWVRPNEVAPLLVMGGMIGGFLFIRTSARLMRSPRVPWWPGSVTSGDLHIHHLVWGICAMMATGFLTFAFDPGSPWLEILAALFGIGAGLTLDEFALWLHLDDVYWSEQGRSSIDAVAVAALLGGLAITASPLDSGDAELPAFAGYLFVRFAISAIAALKGKYVMALSGFFIPGVAEIGAIRLGRPGSPWARWRYGDRPDKLERAGEREARWDARRDRWRDIVGGAPSD